MHERDLELLAPSSRESKHFLALSISEGHLKKGYPHLKFF